jgi:hypothetical protein
MSHQQPARSMIMSDKKLVDHHPGRIIIMIMIVIIYTFFFMIQNK